MPFQKRIWKQSESLRDLSLTYKKLSLYYGDIFSNSTESYFTSLCLSLVIFFPKFWWNDQCQEAREGATSRWRPKSHRIKEPLSSTKAKEQENTDIPKRTCKYLKFKTDKQSRLQGFMLPGVHVIMTGLDLVWTRLSDLTSDQQNTTKVMVRLKNGDFHVRLLCLHASMEQASMLERPLGQGSEASPVPIDGTKQTLRITICQELNPANN